MAPLTGLLPHLPYLTTFAPRSLFSSRLGITLIFVGRTPGLDKKEYEPS